MKPDVEKFILDACCGGRHFWIDKDQKNTVFMDVRSVPKGAIELQPSWSVEPDVIASYCDMPFEDSTFRLVIWDIPHKIKKDKGLITKKYGFLGDKWREELPKGFSEIMRVLKPQGVLIFKFNDLDIPFKEVLNLFPVMPIMGTPTKKGVNNTAFFVYVKNGNVD
tara:strand:- start:692 stop:1186 length:495 start_codon:yes stop_codon:yes gene_type:complete